MVFLSVEVVLSLHDRAVRDWGGSFGLRDAGLLESAVSRGETRVYYDPSATAAEAAAAVAWGLIKNHAFIDGNKRTGLAVLITLLELNGLRLVSSHAERVAMVLRAAAGEISEEEWTAWVVRSVGRSEGCFAHRL